MCCHCTTYNDEMHYIQWRNVLFTMTVKLRCFLLQCVSHVLPLYYIQWRNVLYTMTKCTICYDYTSALQCVSHVFPLLHTMLTKPTFEKFWQLWLSPSACTVLCCMQCVSHVLPLYNIQWRQSWLLRNFDSCGRVSLASCASDYLCSALLASCGRW